MYCPPASAKASKSVRTWFGEGPDPNGGWGRNHPLGQNPHRDVF
jgi:hypothetical protein